MRFTKKTIWRCATRPDRNRRRRSAILGGLRRFYDTCLWRVQTRRLILGRDPECRIAVLCGGRDRSTNVGHIVRIDLYIARKDCHQIYFFDPVESAARMYRTMRSEKIRVRIFKSINESLWRQEEVRAYKAGVSSLRRNLFPPHGGLVIHPKSLYIRSGSPLLRMEEIFEHFQFLA
ncbi:MAG: hypothetical protein WCD47_17445 [Candidatus Sulfotelmatobacter sp.]